MKYFILEPEVAGELGKNTKLDTSSHPPVVSKLEYRLSGWLGDDLLESFPCYVVTERLMRRINDAHLSGVVFSDVEITTSPEFREMYPNRKLPRFLWLKIIGISSRNDFGLTQDSKLVVSEHALAQLQLLHLKHCTITPV